MARGPTIVGVLARAHRASLIAVAMSLLAVGCGSSRILIRPSTASVREAPEHSSPSVTIPLTIPTPGPTGIHPSGADVSVIRGWADALRRGDVRAAARYFALPSVMINGADASGDALAIAIHTLAQAQAANASLPCGAQLISADQRGRYVNALFRLTGRPGLGGSSCATGVGETARTNFVIAHGLIMEWIRAPDDPGDNGAPAAPTPGVLPPSGPTV